MTSTGIGRFCISSFNPSCLVMASNRERAPLGSDASVAPSAAGVPPSLFAPPLFNCSTPAGLKLKVKSQPPSSPVPSKTSVCR